MRRMSNLVFVLAAAMTLALSPQSARARSKTPIHGSFGDAVGSAECPVGQQLVGFSGRWGLWVDRIQIVCATPLAGGHFSQPVAKGPEFGGAGGVRSDGVCPLDTMMTGATLRLTTADRQVASLDIRCVSRATGEPNYASFGNLDYKRCAGGGISDCPAYSPSDLACPTDEAPVGINVRYGQHVNALGLICARVAAAATPASPKVVHHTGSPKPAGLAPVVTFGGKWELVTGTGGHFELTLQPSGDGRDAMGAAVQMQVGGSFTNTDGVHQYDGTLSGVVQPNTRQLVYSYTQQNGQSGAGVFTLSDDGGSLTGEGVQGGKDHFTWSGQRAP